MGLLLESVAAFIEIRRTGQIPPVWAWNPCEEMRCETCGKIVAFLIFADDATDDGLFEDFARLMYPHYTSHNVSTYIIGPELGDGPMEHQRSGCQAP